MSVLFPWPASTSLAAAASLFASLWLAGCAGVSGSPPPLTDYQPEAFGASAVHSRTFAADTAHTCEAARRALLSQGYALAAREAGQVVARKFFQPSADHHVQLEFRVVCAALRENGQEQTVAFASGLQEQYGLRRVKDSASVGVGGVASLSLPLEGGRDSMVKVSSETMTDAQLYQRFFDLMARFLPTAVVTAAPGAVPAWPASAASAPLTFSRPPQTAQP
ncbi:DUF2242 domain-containing protein [Comamonadaceae bacterium OH2545_COT-014]|nr:DUF2242 domain-containing protein [Comamonadaceae bacterium OH2545_COT-014]